MLRGATLLAVGAVLSDLPFLQDVLIGAGAGSIVARLVFVALEHGDTPVSDIHRRRIEAALLSLGAAVATTAYMLLG